MDKLNENRGEFWFTILKKEDLRKLWNPEVEIIFMLRGTGQIYFENMKTAHTIKEEDIFVINSFEMQNFELDESAIALSFSVSIEFIRSMNPELLKYKINCRSYLHGENKQEPFDLLRRDLARAFEEQYKNIDHLAPYLRGRTATILEDLSRYFLERNQPIENKGSFESLKSAINYVQAHYKENITLENLEEQTFLSKTYISRSFTRHFGISFTDYVTMLRLKHATKMIQGKDTLIDIAYESGFPNVNAMINVFKRYRGITPGEYRKKFEISESNLYKQEGTNTEETIGVFDSLMKYGGKSIQTEITTESIKEITVCMNGRKQKILPHWKRMINVGYARSLVDGITQKEIRYLQKKIGFEYIRIKGILDDDMCLLRVDMHGNTVINYSYVDEVLDFILSVDSKPMIELGYMPQMLAKDNATRSMRSGYLSIPKDIEQWHTFIKSLMEHLVKRYGNGIVRKWMFAPWVVPDFMDFGLCSQEEYEETYFAAYSAIKEVNPNFIITGPGSTDLQKHLKWFIDMCKRRECIPDVITFRSFATVIGQEENGLNLITNNESFSRAVSADENLLQNIIKEMKCVLHEKGLKNYPIVLEEWSNNVWQRDLCNDTCYKSAYLFKNILENNQNINAMGYFSINDRIDEIPPAEGTFHGGFGLFTKNDIPKSACRALELLGQMGDKLLQSGDGYFITRRDSEIQIFLYNYSHYDLLYRYRHVVNMSRTSRYQVFVPKEPQAFYIRFEDMEIGKYEVRRYGITRDGGSSFDAWVKMGAPDPLDVYERGLLEHLSHPIYQKECIEVSKEDGILNVKASLNPLDVWLIKIKCV